MKTDIFTKEPRALTESGTDSEELCTKTTITRGLKKVDGHNNRTLGVVMFELAMLTENGEKKSSMTKVKEYLATITKEDRSLILIVENMEGGLILRRQK